ncbi:hypothetical protein CONPUDRAFT_75407 [Coniophora puteana RWD-64-598 SS2]|uniref:F-box domain-containing protein n=1 Tax=Coniophora puteana (strain RWD-64-598) TaxID=741705 RepID=A0A5M3ME96_CONPW|nr:uncharacterized protein CONPUDRAFT_75407 [Coniophora puteana RWD-64-598 SS2]EIW77548.1 hypothetical protein CONPUDRAFT_75407 [Coniophora puteana RWD-64-598 SS2]
MALPFELLISIFDLACYPPQPQIFDPALWTGHDPMSGGKQGMRFQQGLTLICKAWSGPAKELLYRDITIRTVNQLPLLEHTLLNDSTSALALMIKSLRLLCDVSPTQHHPQIFDPALWTGHDPMSGGKQGMRFQQGLTLICKAWSGPAKELLYRDITIRTVNQLPLLEHTLLNDSTSALALMIKSLRLLCDVSPTQHHVLDLSLRPVLCMCTRLRHLAFNPVLDLFPHPLSTFTLDLQTLPQAHQDTLTRVELGVSVPLSHAVPELTQFPNLVMLSCEVNLLTPTAHGDPYILSRLEDLRLTLSTSDSVAISDSYRSITSALDLPALCKLSLTAVQATAHDVRPCYALFLAKHGSHLRYLAIYGSFFLVLVIEELIQHCPSVEHLVVPRVRSLQMLAHPNVVWLDAWDYMTARRRRQPKDPLDAFENMPRLRGFRIIDRAFFHIAGPVVPLAAPPYLDADAV